LSLLREPGSDYPKRILFFQCHRGLQPELYHNAAVCTQRYKLVMTPETLNKWLKQAAPAMSQKTMLLTFKVLYTASFKTFIFNFR